MLPTVVNNLFKIEGGNMQVPQKLLEYANVLLHHDSTVTHILGLNGRYQIRAEHHGSATVGLSQCWPALIALCNVMFAMS